MEERGDGFNTWFDSEIQGEETCTLEVIHGASPGERERDGTRGEKRDEMGRGKERERERGIGQEEEREGAREQWEEREREREREVSMGGEHPGGQGQENTVR